MLLGIIYFQSKLRYTNNVGKRKSKENRSYKYKKIRRTKSVEQ